MAEGESCEVTEGSNYETLLLEYEELFKDRFTEKDAQYVSSVENIIGPPPVVHPWYNKSRRNFDYTRSRGAQEGYHSRNQWSKRGGGGRDRRSDHYHHPYSNHRYGQRQY